ncbi:hypothetical protein D9M68_474100 [compost metagenome]
MMFLAGLEVCLCPALCRDIQDRRHDHVPSRPCCQFGTTFVCHDSSHCPVGQHNLFLQCDGFSGTKNVIVRFSNTRRFKRRPNVVIRAADQVAARPAQKGARGLIDVTEAKLLVLDKDRLGDRIEDSLDITVERHGLRRCFSLIFLHGSSSCYKSLEMVPPYTEASFNHYSDSKWRAWTPRQHPMVVLIKNEQR